MPSNEQVLREDEIRMRIALWNELTALAALARSAATLALEEYHRQRVEYAKRTAPGRPGGPR